MVDLAPVPDHLLGPLLDAAGAALRSRPPDDVPAAARSLIGFDRRGLARGPARRQLRRALDDDADFRREVLEPFATRDDARALLSEWRPADALAIAIAASERGDLPLLTSALAAAAPEGAEVGIGIAIALAAAAPAARSDSAAVALAESEEARRRLTVARDALAAERDRLAEQLRAARRDRRQSVQDAAIGAERDRLIERVDQLEAQLTDARAQLARADGSRGRALTRAQRAEALHGDALDRVRALERTRDELRRELDAVALPSAAAAPVPEPASGRATRRRRGRVRPALPGGLVADSIEGADAMLRDASVVLVVDGYNVTKATEVGGSLATEREWLVRALEALHLRCGAAIVVVFDGDDSPVFGQRTRRGVRVVFSPAAAEADEVVVSSVSSTPPSVPVVVASSDGWVRDHAETFGAVVVSAATLLGLLRRAP